MMRSKYFDKVAHYHLGRPDHDRSVGAYLADHFDAKKTCLEIGAGSGLGTKLLAGYFENVIAIEPVAELAAKGKEVFELDNVQLHSVPIEETGDFAFDYLICFQATHWVYKSQQYRQFYAQAQKPVLDIFSGVELIDRPEIIQNLFEKHAVSDPYRGFDYPRQLLFQSSYEDRFSAEKIAHGICSSPVIDHDAFEDILSVIQQEFGQDAIRALVTTKVNAVEAPLE